MSICSFGCFPFRFRGRELGYDCASSWSLLSFKFSVASLLQIEFKGLVLSLDCKGFSPNGSMIVIFEVSPCKYLL